MAHSKVGATHGLLSKAAAGLLLGVLCALAAGWPARVAGQSAASERVIFYPPLGLPGVHTLADGQPVGLYPELLKAVAEAANLKYEVRSADWPEPLDAVRSGRGDVLGPVMGQPSSFNDLVHTMPLMRVEWARYVRSGESRSASGIVFQGVRLAVLADSFGTRWLSREHPSAIQVPVESIADGLRALVNREADALLALKLPARHLILEGLEGQVEEVGTELTAPMTLALAPASVAYLPALNAAIQKLTASGEIERLRNRWMPSAPQMSSEIAQSRMTAVLAVLVGILLLLLGVLWSSNRRLSLARSQADAARRAKGHFLAVMSHEIRTPINGLVNLIDLLQRSGVSTEQSELLLKAEHANRSLLMLVNQVLDYSKIEADRMEIRPHPMDLADLLEQVRAVLAAQTRESGVELECEWPATLPRIVADAQRLSQILINLGGNALKFTHRGHVKVLIRELQDLPVPTGQCRLRFEVTDTGPGIAPDQLEQLFKPFVQLQTGWDRPHQGTGLGLSTSAQLVRHMASELKVESEPDVQTRFWFDLTVPLAPPQTLGVGAESAERAELLVAGRTFGPIRCVLVVDDNPLNLLVTRKILEQEGRRVLQAQSALQALDMVSDGEGPRPDLVLMDLQMPEVDGIEATRRLRDQLGAEMPPVLAVSGAVTDEARQAALRVGMVGFMPKPFNRETLVSTLVALEGG